MLSELRIRNYALIDDLSVHLGPGLNVLTGETGAGKSIVVGALALLLGDRASVETVRAGADRATVEGMFEVEGRSGIAAWLEERGLEAEQGLLVLKREVAVGGRSRAWINGSPATASLLGELGALLVSLHGQHEHQTLLRRTEQRAILDAFGGHLDVLERVAGAHSALASASAELRTLDQRRREVLQRSDYLRHQVAEIDGAGLEEGEDERLEEEIRRLSHAEELIALASSIATALAGDGDSPAPLLGALRRPLDQLVRIDGSQQELLELLDTSYYALEELGSRVADYLLGLEHDPERLEELRRRQDLLFRLRAKYGPTLRDVVETLERARAELAVLDDAEWEMGEIARRRDRSEEELRRLAGELTERRLAAAADLAAEVTRVLPEVGLEGGRFEIARLPADPPGADGAEEIEFLVALNRGFEPKPLAHVASGGELSRVMLALKTILARVDAVPTLIFDEVDAGIGGRVALRVGEKMRQVAASHQVLAITHLAQIASRAHRHLLVTKDDDDARATATLVTTLEHAERVRELARMLGGDPESGASLTHARELLAKGGVAVGA